MPLSLPDTPNPVTLALRCAEIGLRVLPIPPGKKHPPMNAWQDAATVDPKVIMAWWSGLYANHGIGLAPDQLPDGRWWFVVDIDQHGVDGGATWRDLCDGHNGAPDTVEAMTGGGGSHLLFASPREIRNGVLDPGIDIRGKGGQIVTEPSIHPSGRPYSWVDGQAPWEHEIADAPGWLLAMLEFEDVERVKREPSADTGTRPGDLWAMTTDWSELLDRDGWQLHHVDRSGEEYWTRPGKDRREGHSATVGYKDSDTLKMFTSSMTSVNLHQNATYSKIGYLAATRYGGVTKECFSAAASALRDTGYKADSLPALAELIGDSLKGDDLGDRPGPDVAEDDPWGPAKPIPQPDPVPAWPIDIFPQWMQDQVDNVARAVECPPDIPALFGLGALAVAALGRIEIEARPGHIESTSVYAAIVAGVSEGKTPAKDTMMRPVEAYEDEAVTHGKAALASETFERELIEDQIAGLKKQASLGDDSAKRFAQDKIAELEDRPAPRQGRMTTSDATPERLATMMAANGDCMSVVSDEAGPLAIDRYGDKTRGSNLDLYLKGWSGVRHTQDRQKAPSVLLRRPLINFVVAAQPEAWDKAMEDVEFRSRGLGARFMTCRPAPTAWMRTDDLDRDVWDNDAKGAYRTHMGDLCRRFGAWQLPATVVLSGEARTAYKLWAKRITKRTRPGGDLDHELGWTSKLKDTVIRVAGLLHMADGADYATSVEASVMDRACRLGDYWVGHRLHEPGTATRDAERLLGALVVLHEGATAGATGPFVAPRELQRRGPKGLRTIEAYTPALSALINLGLVRLVGATAGEKAQVSVAIRSAVGFAVHPEVLAGRHGATRGDTGRHTPANDTETQREGDPVAPVAPVAISGCFKPSSLVHSSVESETPGDRGDRGDAIGVSMDSTREPQDDDDPLGLGPDDTP